MITETINNYRIIEDNIDKIIAFSGLQISFICEKIGLDYDSFISKRKNKQFSSQELTSLFQVIDIEKIEDKILGEMSLEAENRDEFEPYIYSK